MLETAGYSVSGDGENRYPSFQLIAVMHKFRSAFCVAYTKCVATLWHDRIYLSTRVERLSRGLVSHTCAHCGPIFQNVGD